MLKERLRFEKSSKNSFTNALYNTSCCFGFFHSCCPPKVLETVRFGRSMYILMTTVSSVVKNDTGEVLIGVKIIAKSRFFKDSTTTDSLGFFKIDVPKNQDAALEIVAKDHFYESRVLRIGSLAIKMSDVKLMRVRVGRKMWIKNLNFYGGSTRLLPTSFNK